MARDTGLRTRGCDPGCYYKESSMTLLSKWCAPCGIHLSNSSKPREIGGGEQTEMPPSALLAFNFLCAAAAYAAHTVLCVFASGFRTKKRTG